MAKKPRPNLFYLLLIPVGLAFVLTAIAYGYMAFVDVNAPAADAAKAAGHPLFQWLRRNGDATLISELIVLGVLTIGIIATDGGAKDASPKPTSDTRQALPSSRFGPPEERR